MYHFKVNGVLLSSQVRYHSAAQVISMALDAGAIPGPGPYALYRVADRAHVAPAGVVDLAVSEALITVPTGPAVNS